MKPKTARAKLFFSAAIFSAVVFSKTAALEWPSAQSEIISLFGQKTEGGIERGLIIEGENTIRAAGDGIVLAVISENKNMTGFPSALGSAVLLAHSDGIISVYGNLENTEMISDKKQAETNSIISRAGNSAWMNIDNQNQDEQRGICIFQIMDQTQNTFLNPLLLLPPKEDSRAPVIAEVRLESESEQTYNPASSRRIESGVYKVYVSVTDSFARNSPELAPFRVSIIVNGLEQNSVSFETLIKKRNVLIPNVSPDYLDGTVPLYSDDGAIYAGSIRLSRGRADIAVAARDFGGNERESEFILQVE